MRLARRGQSRLSQRTRVTNPQTSPPPPLAAQIVVAIPVLNEAGFIADCLHTLGVDAPELAAARFVVVDGGSTDGTVCWTTRRGCNRRG